MTINETRTRAATYRAWSTGIEVRADETEAAEVFHRAFERVLEVLAHRSPAVQPHSGFPEATVWLSEGSCRLAMTRELRPEFRDEELWSLTLSANFDTAVESLAAELSLALHRQPFTGRETAAFHAEQPVMQSLVVRHSAAAPFADSEIIVTGHFVTDLVPQIDCLLALGACPDHITVLQKEYAYRYRHRVWASLRERGIRVEAAANAAETVRRVTERGRRCIGIDDGGYIAPAVLALPERAQARWDGVVEQTMSGIFRIEDARDRLPFPLVSVAQSQLKCLIEPRWIAESVVSRIFGLLAGTRLDGQCALVLGYGNIGARIAERLRELGMRVSVCDSDLLKLVDAQESGFRTGRSPARSIAADRPRLIVGATGRTSLGAAELAAMSGDVFLASATSRDIEFDLEELARRSVRSPETAHDTTRYRLSGDVAVTVLAAGRPINFHEADGMPNRRSDLICAALTVGAMALATGSAGRRGVHPAECDRIIAESGLLHTYYSNRSR